MSGKKYDAPNQQVVRPDGSGPADEGSGGKEQPEQRDQPKSQKAESPEERKTPRSQEKSKQ